MEVVRVGVIPQTHTSSYTQESFDESSQESSYAGSVHDAQESCPHVIIRTRRTDSDEVML